MDFTSLRVQGDVEGLLLLDELLTQPLESLHLLPSDTAKRAEIRSRFDVTLISLRTETLLVEDLVV